MKKILSEGSTVKHRLTCGHCNCTFEYDDSDIEYGYPVGRYYRFVILCPNCNKKLYGYRHNNNQTKITTESLKD